jgi:sugar phosphate isomerase/epimerase
MNANTDRLTGFADECAPGLDEQIAMHKELGWNSIELRNVGGINICEMDDYHFEQVYRNMQDANMRAACFASAIANWARSINTPFEKDEQALLRSVPRMGKLGTKFIRIMSYQNDGATESEWKKESIARLTRLTRIAEDNEIILVLENCDGWASTSPEHLVETMQTIDSKAFRIVFDTGNPISHLGTTEETWDWYRAALPYIVHFHIKDCKLIEGKPVHQFPGQGDSDVRNIITDLLKNGYEGMFSIEPHIHKENPIEQYRMYKEYGTIANQMISELIR